MSQHSDILKWEIAEGIHEGLTPTRIVQRIQGILDVMEWDEDTVSAVPGDALVTAKWMSVQKDGLYGVSRDEIEIFMTQLTKAYNLNPVGFN